MRKSYGLLLLAVYFLLLPAVAVAADCKDMPSCMADMLESAADNVTIGEIRQTCMNCVREYHAKHNLPLDQTAEPSMKTWSEPSAIDARLAEEEETSQDWFVLTPHRANYILPVAYNDSPNSGVYGSPITEADIDKTEIKFQISIKYKLFDDIYKNNGDFYIAYTNLSYWQAYNSNYSSPFRDTNHEPEAWLQFDTDYELFGGFNLRLIGVGFLHQSNGRTEPLSRSWNRLFMNFVFEKENFALAVKPWYRIPEDDEDDDNPDIEKYLGYGELRAAYRWNDHTFSLMFRNNLRDSGNKGAVELGWSFPLYRKLKGYVQYFNGYGQSILDYNDCANTIGAGIALSDIL